MLRIRPPETSMSFPSTWPLPGVGFLPVNAYLLMAEEPVLIDTGIGVDGEDFIAAVSSFVDPRQLKWVWLTHDDADHTGSIQRIMDLAPNASSSPTGSARSGWGCGGRSRWTGCTRSASVTRSTSETAR